MAATMLSAKSSVAFAGKALAARPQASRVQVRPADVQQEHISLSPAAASAKDVPLPLGDEGYVGSARQLKSVGMSRSIPTALLLRVLDICRPAPSHGQRLAAGCRAARRRRTWRRPSECLESVHLCSHAGSGSTGCGGMADAGGAWHASAALTNATCSLITAAESSMLTCALT